MSKPGPPFLSWVGVKPTSAYLPALGQVPPEPGKGKDHVGWTGGVAAKMEPQVGKEGENRTDGAQWH